jgi:hypothetical protein
MDLFCPCCNIGIDYQQMKARKCNNCLCEWMVIHVIPLNDLKPHRYSHVCHCIPEVECEDGNMVVVHNSYDGREGIEWAKEILK